MNSLRFTVECNGKNPVPYKRTTQKQKFKDLEYHKYLQWKDEVVTAFMIAFNKYPYQLLAKNKKVLCRYSSIL